MPALFVTLSSRSSFSLRHLLLPLLSPPPLGLFFFLFFTRAPGHIGVEGGHPVGLARGTESLEDSNKKHRAGGRCLRGATSTVTGRQSRPWSFMRRTEVHWRGQGTVGQRDRHRSLERANPMTPADVRRDNRIRGVLWPQDRRTVSALVTTNRGPSSEQVTTCAKA